jgi:hypothetical protein
MFDGTFPQNDEPDPNTVAVDEDPPWQLFALLLALVVVNCLAAVFYPDAITDPGVKF